MLADEAKEIVRTMSLLRLALALRLVSLLRAGSFIARFGVFGLKFLVLVNSFVPSFAISNFLGRIVVWVVVVRLEVILLVVVSGVVFLLEVLFL